MPPGRRPTPRTSWAGDRGWSTPSAQTLRGSGVWVLRSSGSLATMPPWSSLIATRGVRVMEIRDRELADPGGRYAVETGTSTFARLAQELAQVLNEGDARGRRVLHIHGAART